MPTERFYFRECLKNELEQRRRKRDGYSLRSFAKSLEIQAPTLSAVLAGKRTLSQQSALQIIQKLKLSPLEESRFLDSLQAKRKRKAPNAVVSPMALMTGARYIEEEIYFHVIAEWEFYAILSLTEVKGFVGEPDWIAKSLGITSKRAADCLDSLLELGLLKRTKAAKKFEKSQGLVRTSEDVSSRALQLSHRESLEMGLRKLEILPVHKTCQSITLRSRL
ncbi:MAG: TIGR02147 family protein [Proteobacteria bacterium]|nr:TIGR02147 family protein [Pseudomonadota bacterium]